ncbi:alpha-tocopherol transfer protein-like [Stomoxys calcitrans]|uniref:alpha-tocopherol transfer protein-like n=1 Tax=Stomoxys calcitrans TaxID=35570 RepID=UPI0027E36E1A|nr:alpha-tocopherol transfer protein-like [Stomoxys calcitrans]
MANIKPLSEELQKIACEELNEVPSRIPEDLAALRQWLQLQPHLKVRDDDQFLVQFLRGCKYSLEKAKEKIDLFYSLKSRYPEMFNTTDVKEEEFRKFHRLGCFQILPKPLHETGPRIAFVRYNYSTKDYNIEDLTKLIVAMVELSIIHDPYICINGMVYIVDIGSASPSHFLQITPNYCKKSVSFIEKSMPLRIKSLYFINNSTAAQQAFRILIPLFSEKLQKRIHFIGHNLEELYSEIPIKYLPKEYGGELPSLESITAEYEKTWDENHTFFQENAQYGTDETLRRGKPLDIDGLFGVGGSFRKINVD